MHESHTLIIIKEDEEVHQKHRGILGDEKRKFPRLKVIEFLEIPIGSPKSASCSKYDTIFSPQWLE